MIKKFKKLTACTLVTMLCLSATMPYPVHATEIDQNADTGETKELDENAVPMDNTDTVENETNVQESENNPEPEQNLTKENESSDVMGGTATTQDKSENVLGSEPVMTVSDNIQPLAANNAGSFNVTGGSSGSDWVYDNNANTLTFKNSGNYTITGDGAESAEQIVIGAKINVTVTLNNVNCQPANAGMNIDGSSNVTLVLVGSNTFTSGNYYNAGIEFNNAVNGSLTIKGAGSLYAESRRGDYSGTAGAGIGGGSNSSGNNITIESGSVTVSAKGEGAGIGGGENGSGNNINISGGLITINGYTNGAGIGGGRNGSGSDITISGGNIRLKGNNANTGAGIGGGQSGNGSRITISGGTINVVNSYSNGAGIGGGGNGIAENITITGGTINAGSMMGSGIGSGVNLNSGNIYSISTTISGGIVNASSDYGAGIGGGAGGYSIGTTITGGTITASSNYGVGIGGGSSSNGSVNTSISGGSVKTTGGGGGTDSTPKDGNGKNVYLAKLENQDGNNSVLVGSSTFTRAGNHSDGDTAFYLYLAGEQTHDLSANGLQYKAIWNNNSTFTVKQIPPVPSVDIDSQTASSITVKEPAGAGTYGNAQYRIDRGSWQDSRVFENLKSDTLHTIEVKYAGNNSFTESGIGKKEDVNTAPATYTITIPQETLTAGNESSKNEMSVDTNNFDLGYGGKVDVKVSNTGSISSDGNLTLTRQQAIGTTTITSALLVDGIPFNDISKPVATFKSTNDSPVSISFAKPAETEILAGTYSGTITFEVSYSEP